MKFKCRSDDTRSFRLGLSRASTMARAIEIRMRCYSFQLSSLNMQSVSSTRTPLSGIRGAGGGINDPSPPWWVSLEINRKYTTVPPHKFTHFAQRFLQIMTNSVSSLPVWWWQIPSRRRRRWNFPFGRLRRCEASFFGDGEMNYLRRESEVAFMAEKVARISQSTSSTATCDHVRGGFWNVNPGVDDIESENSINVSSCDPDDLISALAPRHSSGFGSDISFTHHSLHFFSAGMSSGHIFPSVFWLDLLSRATSLASSNGWIIYHKDFADRMKASRFATDYWLNKANSDEAKCWFCHLNRIHQTWAG